VDKRTCVAAYSSSFTFSLVGICEKRIETYLAALLKLQKRRIPLCIGLTVWSDLVQIMAREWVFPGALR